MIPNLGYTPSAIDGIRSFVTSPCLQPNGPFLTPAEVHEDGAWAGSWFNPP
jgi:hypothetical protein